jgi:hypothetical protein
MDLGNKHNDFESMRKEKHDIDCQLADINSKHEILRSERDQIDLKCTLRIIYYLRKVTTHSRQSTTN